MAWRKIWILFVVGAVAAAALLSGYTKNKEASAGPEPDGRIVARVNGTPITEEDLAFRVPRAHGESKSSANQGKALDDVIAEELLYQQGLKMGFEKDPGYRAQIARIERQLAHVKRAEMTRRVYNSQVAAKIEITSADAKNYYDRNAGQISTELHLGVIAFSSREAAQAALNRVRGGAPFESIAREMMGSQVSAGREPWDLGFLSWEQIPIDFTDAVYRLKPGETSGVVSSKRTGHQIFKLLGARKNSPADYTKMSGVIMNRLRDSKVMEEYDRYVEKLKKQAKIEKFAENPAVHPQASSGRTEQRPN